MLKRYVQNLRNVAMYVIATLPLLYSTEKSLSCNSFFKQHLAR
uniref:Uncharacterized protein n=1 Tax=Arundo donax TaxID=35708 RepID=A0A0A9EBP1_ARUDO